MTRHDQSQIFARRAGTIRCPLAARFKTRNRCPVVAAHGFAPALLPRSILCFLMQTLPAAHGWCVLHPRGTLRLQSACAPRLPHKPVRKPQAGQRYQPPLQQEPQPAAMRTVRHKTSQYTVDPDGYRLQHTLCERAIRMAELRACQDSGKCGALRSARRGRDQTGR